MTKLPTIGRTVMYVPSEKEKERFGATKSGFLPAMVVEVYGPDMVNLRVFTNSTVADEWVTSVELSNNKAPRSWHWPEIK